MLKAPATRASLKVNGLDVVPQKQMKNFLALKNKIIHTDELIGRFQAKAKECDAVKRLLKETQTRVSTLEQGMAGLRMELQAIHEDNKQLQLYLERSEQEVERSSSQLASSDLLVQQLTAQVDQLQESDHEALRKERNSLQEEKEKLQKKYLNLKKGFEAYKLSSHGGDRLFKPPNRCRRNSTASSCSSFSITSPPYPSPSLVSSAVTSIFQPPASSHLSFTSPPEPTNLPASHHLSLNGNSLSTATSLQNGVPRDPPSLPQSVELPEVVSSPMVDADTGIGEEMADMGGVGDEMGDMDEVGDEMADMDEVGDEMADMDESGDDDLGLSCSDTNSECSESSLSSLDDLADLLNSETASPVEAVEDSSLSTAGLTSDPAAEGEGSQPSSMNMPVIAPSTSPTVDQEQPITHTPTARLSLGKDVQSIPFPCLSQPAPTRPHASLSTVEFLDEPPPPSCGPTALGHEEIVPRETRSRYTLRKRHRSYCLDLAVPVAKMAKRRCSEESCMATHANVDVPSLLPLPASQGGEDTVELGATSEESEQMESVDVDGLPTHESASSSSPDIGTLSPPPLLQGFAEGTAAIAPPSSLPQVIVQTPKTPELVSAEADTASSDDITASSDGSDSDMSLLEIHSSLSPIPPSPAHRLPTLSPLPPSPEPHGRRPLIEVISPLPFSPPHTHSRQIDTPLSPLPPSPCNEALSPLPLSPLRPPLDSTELGADQVLEPLQFASSAPNGLQTPRPCASLCRPSPSSLSVPVRGELHPSAYSPFSPPLATPSDTPSQSSTRHTDAGDCLRMIASVGGQLAAEGQYLSTRGEGTVVVLASGDRRSCDPPVADRESPSSQTDPPWGQRSTSDTEGPSSQTDLPWGQRSMSDTEGPSSQLSMEVHEDVEEGEITDDDEEEEVSDLAESVCQGSEQMLRRTAPSVNSQMEQMDPQKEPPAVTMPDASRYVSLASSLIPADSESGGKEGGVVMPTISSRTEVVVMEEPQPDPESSWPVGYGQRATRSKHQTLAKIPSLRLNTSKQPGRPMTSFDNLLSSVTGSKPRSPQPKPTPPPASTPHMPEATPTHSLPGYQLRSRGTPLLGQLAGTARRPTNPSRARTGEDPAAPSSQSSRPASEGAGRVPAQLQVTGEAQQGGGAVGRPLRTDVATGQWENPTPSSSPKPTDSDSACAEELPTPSSTVAPSSSSHPHIHQPGLTASPPPLSLAQRQLSVCMLCPLPLPPWLVTSMAKVQFCSEQTQRKNKKRGNPKAVINRQRSQQSLSYVLLNLQRLVHGQVYLSTAVAMFSNPLNAPSVEEFVGATMKFFCEHYFPRSEHVVSLYHELCNVIRANPHFHPLDSSCPAPLTKPDCQIVALLATICMTNKNLAQLLPELTKALYQTILSPGVKFHCLSALCRVFVSLCRLQGDRERVQFFVCDLLRRPLQPNEFPLLVCVASAWPAALGRHPGVVLVERNTLVPAGVEVQVLSYTIEVVAVSIIAKVGGGDGKPREHGHMLRNLHSLCHWSQAVPPRTLNTLVKILLNVLQTSPQVFIDSLPSGMFPWRRPRPSVAAFRVVHCLRMLVWLQGWMWTNDTLIGAHLWPLLQKWYGKNETVREATVVCAIRLIGFIAQQGLAQDPNSPSIQKLQQVLLSLLSPSSPSPPLTLPIQLAAADSLLDLCPQGQPKAREAVGAISKWVQGLARTPAGPILAREFHSRLIT